MKIKTAKEYSDEFYDLIFNNYDSQQDLIRMFKEYAEQFISLAAEEAKTKEVRSMYQGMTDFITEIYIDKESILKVKQLIK